MPTETTRDLTPIARAIHEGLGESWAYANYGGDEWNSMRTELMSAAASAWQVMAPEIERLLKIEKAARNVAETLNGGFVVCQACGEQEATTDLDFARELYQALGVQEKKRVR